VSSTLEEWAKTGRLLFSNGRYRQAKLCFDRAELPLERDISHAYHLRQDARPLERGSKQRKIAFLSAAKAFWVCGPKAEGVQKIRCFNRAAECYVEAEHLNQASDAYYHAKEWTMAARYARLAGKFDRAIEIIGEGGVDPLVANSITQVAKVFYLQAKQIEYVKYRHRCDSILTHIFRKARLLFESDEDFLELMDEYGFEKVPVLEKLGRYIEAGHLRAAAGEAIPAIRLFTRGGDHDRAAQCLCDAFWEQLPYNTTVTDSNRTQVRTLEKLLPGIIEPSDHLKNEVSLHEPKRQVLMCCYSSLCSVLLSTPIRKPLRNLRSHFPKATPAVPMPPFYGASTTSHGRSKTFTI
jgi:tetratricopeptide (TPR) repeat protein